MTTTPQADKLIATRVRKGANPTESAQLLNELATAHTGDNLASALTYQGFATARARSTPRTPWRSSGSTTT